MNNQLSLPFSSDDPAEVREYALPELLNQLDLQ